MTPNEGAAALRSLFPILTVPPAALHAAAAAAGVTRSVCAEYVRRVVPYLAPEVEGGVGWAWIRYRCCLLLLSPPLPTRSVVRSVGRGDDERSIHHAVRPFLPLSPSPLPDIMLARSLARWDRPFTHSSSSRVSPSLRPCDATPVLRPAHHPSIPFFVMPLQLTIKANRRSERASESASVAANEEASSKWSASECGAMGDAASSPSHLNNNRARG